MRRSLGLGDLSHKVEHSMSIAGLWCLIPNNTKHGRGEDLEPVAIAPAMLLLFSAQVGSCQEKYYPRTVSQSDSATGLGSYFLTY